MNGYRCSVFLCDSILFHFSKLRAFPNANYTVVYYTVSNYNWRASSLASLKLWPALNPHPCLLSVWIPASAICAILWRSWYSTVICESVPVKYSDSYLRPNYTFWLWDVPEPPVWNFLISQYEWETCHNSREHLTLLAKVADCVRDLLIGPFIPRAGTITFWNNAKICSNVILVYVMKARLPWGGHESRW